MSAQRLTKDTDDEARFRCANGIGILREEVWVDEAGEVVRYNLAFLLPHLQSKDHGRILGYDNAHGQHERHWYGKVSPVIFVSYCELAKHFYREVGALRSHYENQNLP